MCSIAGALDGRIPLPQGRKQQGVWFSAKGPLTGDTAERMRQFKERFSKGTRAYEMPARIGLITN